MTTPRRGGRFYANFDAPLCSRQRVVLGNIFFSAEYTNPGYFGFRAEYRQQDTNGSWGPTTFTPWRIASAPSDGQVYWTAVGTLSAPHDYLVIGYEVAWWTGSSWSHFEVVQAEHYTWDDGTVRTFPVDVCIA